MTYRPSLEQLEPRELLAGFTPAQVRAAYGFAQAFHAYGAAGQGQGVTVAVVIAMDAPLTNRALAVYSRRYHLPQTAVTTINLGGTGNGGAFYGFPSEAALDVETVHALLPLARIILVEAKTPWLSDLAYAEQVAAAQPGVDIVSNSWGVVDTPIEGYYPPLWMGWAFRNPAVVYVAAAGDTAGPMWYPADSPAVVGVGGTVLTHDRRGYHQRPWLSYTAGPSNPAKYGPDVMMVGAKPGISVYGPEGFLPSSWNGAYGTSLATPAFAAVVGVADGIRMARGEAPLTTAQVLAGLTPGEVPWVPNFITRFA